MTKNEFRQVIGMKPSDDPRADELRNSNISESNEEIKNRLDPEGTEQTVEEVTSQNGEEV